ncbi:insulinase family protein [Actinoplanes sp. HUAS TT8]|uniref:insulinase family protein n=1 Tax=Actinoplanes sp. HUAS TT8 TaxID=3447453 RepID=UPI003F51BEF2
MSTRFEIGGVPGRFTETTGPLRAGLVFRVGAADEPLARRGITHLIGHLADPGAHGVVAADVTMFLAEGSADDVRTWLAGIGAALRDLPTDRLPEAKRALSAEAAARHAGASELMAIRRHGARGYGLTAYPEFGLTGLTAEDLKTWKDHYFVRPNAALWITGPYLPDDLELDLPDGRRPARPAVSSALPVTPAYFHGPTGVVVWDTVVPYEPAAVVLTHLLTRELQRRTGHTGVEHTPRADGTTLITVIADAPFDRRDTVLAAVIAVLDRMRDGGFDDADLAAAVGQPDDRPLGRAIDVLLDLDEQAVVTRADVTRVARAAFTAGLLQTPGDTTAEHAGYTAAPIVAAEPVTGQAYPSLADPVHSRVVLSGEGASVVEGTITATVRFDACVAALAWPDGARRLIGADGAQVHLEPALFHGLAAAVPVLDQHLPAGLRAEMAPRDPQSIPRPVLQLPTIGQPARPAAPARPVRSPSGHTRRGYLLNLILCVAVILALSTGTVDPAELQTLSGSHPIDNLAALLFILAFPAARGIWAIHGLVRLHRRRGL